MNKLPRIAHIISPLTWRGGEQQAVYLYEELEKLEVYQFIICAKGSAMETYCMDHDLRHYSLKKHLNIDLGFAKKIKQICEREKIDVIHPHDSGAHTLAILSAVLYRHARPIVLHRRVDFPISNSWFSRYKYNHPSIKKIICVSEAIKRIMEKDIRRKEILTVVYDGIDVTRFTNKPSSLLRSEFQIDSGKPIIANIAALSQQKDYFTFIDAVRLLVNAGTNAAFFAFGDGPQKEEILTYAESQGLRNVIHFAGFRKDIPAILPEIDLLLFTSETEGLGTTILDCFAAGVPVVSTDAGGIPELIVHLNSGFLGKVKNPKSLAEGVMMALREPEIRAKWIQAGKERVQLFTREITAKKTLSIYEEIKAV